MKHYLEVAYRLYDVSTEAPQLKEEATEEVPFTFITSLDMALPAFEEKVAQLEKGASFDFTLQPEEAFGIRMDDRVLDLDKEIFTINGHFDHDNIFIGADVPLRNADGNIFNGHVLAITDDKVRMDLNHPLAGMTLRFEGKVLEKHEATDEEVKRYTEPHCHCGADCGHDHDHEGCDHDHCGCGHCHE